MSQTIEQRIKAQIKGAQAQAVAGIDEQIAALERLKAQVETLDFNESTEALFTQTYNVSPWRSAFRTLVPVPEEKREKARARRNAWN